MFHLPADHTTDFENICGEKRRKVKNDKIWSCSNSLLLEFVIYLRYNEGKAVIKMETKDVILQLRTRKGLSQEELAAKIYVTELFVRYKIILISRKKTFCRKCPGGIYGQTAEKKQETQFSKRSHPSWLRSIIIKYLCRRSLTEPMLVELHSTHILKRKIIC